MLKRSVFSLCSASVVALGGLVWSAGTGCSGSDAAATGGADGGDGSTSSSSSSSSSSGGPDTGSSTSSTSSTSSSGSSGADTGTPVTGVPITYGTCPAFQKCESSPIGNYTVSGGCLSNTAFDSFKANCPGLQESNVKITASGTIDVDALLVSRDTVTNVAAHAVVPRRAHRLAIPSARSFQARLRAARSVLSSIRPPAQSMALIAIAISRSP